MLEEKPTGDTRDDRLQRTVGLLFSLSRHIHRSGPTHEPMLSRAQARLLFTIARHREAGMSVKDLARISAVTPGAITQFADVLISKGLVSREEDPDDRRVVRLKLTTVGEGQMKSLREALLASVSSSFDALSSEELGQLNELLSKVILHSPGERQSHASHEDYHCNPEC